MRGIFTVGAKYLIDIAIRNIEGKITIKEVQNLIRQISRSLFTANSFGVFTTTPER